MQIPDALTLAFALVVACASTSGHLRWWYGRRLKAAQQKIEKLNHNRTLYDQHTAQARGQIEQLDHDGVIARASSGHPRRRRRRRRRWRSGRRACRRCARRASSNDLARLLEAGDRLQAAQQPSHAGWQATQPGDIGWLPTQQIDERPDTPPARAAASSSGRRGFSDTQPA